MIRRAWFESDAPLAPVVPAHAWVGETIEPMRDGDTLVIHASAPDAVAWIGPQGQLMIDAIYQAWSESIGKDEAHKWRPLKLMYSDAR